MGHRNGGGLVTSGTEGPPVGAAPSRRSGASRADHSGQGAGEAPGASDVGLQALTSAESPIQPARDAPPLAETPERGGALKS